MSAGALFGSTATGPGSTGGNKHLVEMRAGKMNLKGRMIYPDKRKGQLYVYQSDDSLMHFCWQDRSTGVVEDDLIIFPDDCEYVKVPQCTTGRAYLLKFKSSSRKFFFWLQEPRTDKDEEHCKRINEILNNPSSINQCGHNPEQDLQSLLSSMSQSQLVQFFGGSGQMGGLSSLLATIRGPGNGSARTSSTPAITHRNVMSTPTSGSGGATAASGGAAAAPAQTTPQNAPIVSMTPGAPKKGSTPTPHPARQSSQGGEENVTSGGNGGGSRIQLSDLQNFLQDISPMVQQQSQNPQASSVDLSTALTTDSLSSILNDPEALGQLEDHLPPVSGSNPQETLRNTITSPQFQSAVSQFSSALETGQLAPLVSQMAVSPEAVTAAAEGNMQEFVKALEKNSTPPPAEKKDEKKDDKDEEMQLD